MPDKVSVVIPAYNSERTIRLCLDSVLRQKGVGEIIVVDDSSQDKTHDVLKKYGEKIKVLKNPKNMGLAKTLNRGVEKSKHDFVCTLHSDCVLPKKWVEEQLKLFDNKTAVVTSKIVLPKKVWDKFSFWNKIFFSKFLSSKKIICENKCDIYKKDVLKKTGWFSKDFRVAGEDFDLYNRLTKAGYNVKCSDLEVKHIMSSHQLGFWKYLRKELQYGEARGVILRKHKFLILFNPFAFRLWPDLRLIAALPIVIILRALMHFIGFWKGLLTGRQTW